MCAEDPRAFDHDEAFAVTAGALRYALGRHSYAPSRVWGLIKRHWNDPSVMRQRECILRDIEEYLTKARKDHDSAVEDNKALAALKEHIETVIKGLHSPYAGGPLRRVLETVNAEIEHKAGFVPKYPDLDIEITWLPAVTWIKEHMKDNIENES